MASGAREPRTLRTPSLVEEGRRLDNAERDTIRSEAQAEARRSLAAIIRAVGHPVTVRRSDMVLTDRDVLTVSEDPMTGDLTYALREAATPPADGPGLREALAEVAVLRAALADANQIVSMTREHLYRDHPDCAYTGLGVMNDAGRAALAAPTQPTGPDLEALLDEMSEAWVSVERAIWPDGPAHGSGSGAYATLKARIIVALGGEADGA